MPDPIDDLLDDLADMQLQQGAATATPTALPSTLDPTQDPIESLLNDLAGRGQLAPQAIPQPTQQIAPTPQAISQNAQPVPQQAQGGGFWGMAGQALGAVGDAYSAIAPYSPLLPSPEALGAGLNALDFAERRILNPATQPIAEQLNVSSWRRPDGSFEPKRLVPFAPTIDRYIDPNFLQTERQVASQVRIDRSGGLLNVQSVVVARFPSVLLYECLIERV